METIHPAALHFHGPASTCAAQNPWLSSDLFSPWHRSKPVSFGVLIWLNEKAASACGVARQPPPPVFRFPISCLIHAGALPPCRRCVVLGRVQRCPRPCATLSTAVINVVRGRGQRAEPVLVTDFPLEAMERRGDEADNSVPSTSFGHLRASKGGDGVSICEMMPIFAVQHFTQCIE